MSTIESNGLITMKDKDGNFYLVYPITRKENIADLSVATTTEDGLFSATDKKKLDGVLYTLGSDEKGVYMESIS